MAKLNHQRVCVSSLKDSRIDLPTSRCPQLIAPEGCSNAPPWSDTWQLLAEKKGQSGQSLLFVTIFDISSRGLYLLFSAQLGTGIIHDNPSSFRSIGYFSEIGPPWGLRRWTHGKPLEPKLLHRRKSRSQNSDNMDRWKAEQGRGREKRKIRRRERVRRKKMQMRDKVGKSRNIVFFQWFGAPEGRKVGSLKRRVRSQLARWEMKNCTPLWREAHLQVKMYKTPGSRSTFGSWDVEKVHAVVARSTFPSQNVQNTPRSEVAMLKKCTPLWRKAHFQVKMCKTHHVRTIFGGSDVEKVVARSTFRSQNVKNTRGSDQFWRSRCRFAWQAQGILHLVKSEQKLEGFEAFSTTTTTTPQYTPIHYTTLQLQLQLHYILLHYAPLHYTALNYATLHYITRHYTPLHYTTLHYLPLHFTILHYTTLHNTTTTTTQLHSTTLHYPKLHSTTLKYTALHYITLHYTTLHYTTLPSTTLHYIILHYTPLNYTTLHYTTLPSTTLHCITLHYVPQHYN